MGEFSKSDPQSPDGVIRCDALWCDESHPVDHDWVGQRDGPTSCRDQGRCVVMPERIQLRRTKGWRKPEGAVVVSRPTKWGNPITLQMAGRLAPTGTHVDGLYWTDEQRRMAVDWYSAWLTAPVCEVTRVDLDRRDWILDHIGDLTGRDLCCWCPLTDEHGVRVPCHADVLLDLANREAS